jgi:hypothetical protein
MTWLLSTAKLKGRKTSDSLFGGRTDFRERRLAPAAADRYARSMMLALYHARALPAFEESRMATACAPAWTKNVDRPQASGSPIEALG